MGIFDKLKGEFIDIIEWTDDSRDTMVYRFERYGNEIKYGAKLVVRESQKAVFINMGKLADVFEPGMYELETKNLPLLSTLMGWSHGFNSPFKAEVYFVNTKRFTDLKWGTKNPVMLRDPEFGPIRLRAFGSYSVRIAEPAKFIKEIAGTDGRFTMDEIMDEFRNIFVSKFTDALGESKIPALDLAASYNELSELMVKHVGEEFKDYGIELLKTQVENISLPDSVNEALDKRSSMGVIGNLNQYTQYQTANAIEDAAKNPGGMAAGGMGMGMGFAMANQMGQTMAPNQQQPAAAAPPPLPSQDKYFIAVNGQQTGPFDLQTIRNKISGGEVRKETLVWKNGMAAWTKAGEVEPIKGLFGAAPPPLPPG